MFEQLTHAIGLNDVCDSLRHHVAKLAAIRVAVAPSRSTLLYANKHRNSDMMEELFWTPSIAQSEVRTVGSLQWLAPPL